jgi:malate synthase
VVIGVEVRARAGDRFDEVLTEEALQFVAGLQREFGGRRGDLLRAREERQARLDAGERPDFLPETRASVKRPGA